MTPVAEQPCLRRESYVAHSLRACWRFRRTDRGDRRGPRVRSEGAVGFGPPPRHRRTRSGTRCRSRCGRSDSRLTRPRSQHGIWPSASPSRPNPRVSVPLELLVGRFVAACPVPAATYRAVAGWTDVDPQTPISSVQGTVIGSVVHRPLAPDHALSPVALPATSSTLVVPAAIDRARPTFAGRLGWQAVDGARRAVVCVTIATGLGRRRTGVRCRFRPTCEYEVCRWLFVVALGLLYVDRRSRRKAVTRSLPWSPGARVRPRCTPR